MPASSPADPRAPARRASYVRDVFTRIAPRYDLMNRLMTGGQDLRWRREVIALARLTAGDRLLDLGAGTGDLALEALQCTPGAQAVAADFTLAMMHTGQQRPAARQSNLTWSAADALHLPFPAESFDALISGFLLRNVVDLDQALREQYRILKPGGRWVALDTTRPTRNLFSPFIAIHLHFIIPTLGWLLTGQRDAYTYLPTSTENFLSAETLAERLQAAGFRQVQFRRKMLGTIAIHWAVK